MGLSNEGCAQDCWVFHACRLTRALHGSKAQGKQKCPEDNLEVTQGSRKSSFARQCQEQSVLQSHMTSRP